MTIEELMENLGHFYARHARHKLLSGEVSLRDIAQSFLCGGVTGVPRLGDLCKKLRKLYGAVPLLTQSQMNIVRASSRPGGEVESFGDGMVARLQHSSRHSVIGDHGWAEALEEELGGTDSEFKGDWLLKRNSGGLMWKSFFCTLQNQYLNCALKEPNPHKRGEVAKPAISYNFSKLKEITRKGDILKLRFKQRVDRIVLFVYFRAPDEEEAVAWHRRLLLRHQAVLLRDQTLR